jgi:hypothetical protein
MAPLVGAAGAAPEPTGDRLRPPVVSPIAPGTTLKLVAEPPSPTSQSTTAESAALQFFLEFDTMQSEPKHAQIFLATGGAIAAAQTNGTTDFAVSGSDYSVAADLSDEVCTRVRVPLPTEHYTLSPESKHTVVMDARAKLLVCASRNGAAINGTLGPSVAGQGAVYLGGMLRAAASHANVPMTYGQWRAHSSVVSVYAPKIVDADGRQYDVEFERDQPTDNALAAAEQYLQLWGDGAWKMRQSEFVYAPAPSLTKAVVKVPCGVNDTGFQFVASVLEQRTPHSIPTLEGLLSGALRAEFAFDDAAVDVFLREAAVPGKLAPTTYGEHVAAALSTIAGVLVAYRADGRSAVTPAGVEAIAAESWLQQAPRTPTEANDCDGSAICILTTARTIAATPLDQLADQPFLRAVHNVLVPHYTVGVAVIGASAASAGSEDALGGDKTTSLAGHAAAVLVPTLGLLRALEKGAGRSVASGTGATLSPLVPPAVRSELAEARFRACYPTAAVEALPPAERAELRSWTGARTALTELSAWGAEGTTPAAAILYVADGPERERATLNAQRDTEAFQKVGATIGRSIKRLHVGGADAESPHRFYHDIVEISVPRSHPLWTGAEVRGLGYAASQFVLARHEAGDDGMGVAHAGASARALATETYAAAPLVNVDRQAAEVIDFAAEVSDRDVMPPRGETMRLSDFQTAQLEASLNAMQALHETLAARPTEQAEGHEVAYVVSYQSLVHNPKAVAHLCERISATASTGLVDILEVPGLAQTASGHEAGYIVLVNARIA